MEEYLTTMVRVSYFHEGSRESHFLQAAQKREIREGRPKPLSYVVVPVEGLIQHCSHVGIPVRSKKGVNPPFYIVKVMVLKLYHSNFFG